jgi:hypothetical protein
MGKVAGQRVTFGASARVGAIAASLAAAAALLLPNAALASTSPTIGSAVGDQPCGTADTIQLSSSDPSYAVPTGGTTITDWFFQAASTDTGSVSLLVWRLDPTTGGYNLITVSPTVNLADTNSAFTLPTPIEVQAGDLIGLRISGAVTCYSSTSTMSSTDQFGVAFSTTPTGSPIAIDHLFSPGQLNVRATVDVASNPVVTSADECKNGGWQTLTDSLGTAFRNQGDCVSFVRTGGKNSASG